mmetsp:Transcript_28066/g.52985  ORF Transcript_28066/g.52985 Transcript_28066/m.52985 type:complete len:208 (-) Transcript_28066:82-705(-)
MTTSLPDNNADIAPTQKNKNLAGKEIQVIENSTSDIHVNSSSGDGGREQNNTIGDIEMGTTTNSTNIDDILYYDAMEEDVTAVDSDVEDVEDNVEVVEEFSRILVPHPRYDGNGVPVKELEGDYNDKSEKSARDNITHALFFRKSKQKEPSPPPPLTRAVRTTPKPQGQLMMNYSMIQKKSQIKTKTTRYLPIPILDQYQYSALYVL